MRKLEAVLQQTSWHGPRLMVGPRPTQHEHAGLLDVTASTLTPLAVHTCGAATLAHTCHAPANTHQVAQRAAIAEGGRGVVHAQAVANAGCLGPTQQ